MNEKSVSPAVTPQPASELSSFLDLPVSPPADYFLNLALERTRHSMEFALPTLLPALRNVSYFEHQIETVTQVISQMKGRAIMADEVGMGKTIEAGLVLREYIARGLVKRFLILSPASLTHQWQEELRVKFHLSCSVVTRPSEWGLSPYAITSIDTAKSPRNQAAALKLPHDMVIVDEAHKLRNHKSQNWRFVSQLKARFLLLLTATPIQNSLEELYNLVFLIRPGYLKTRKHFLRTFTHPEDAKVPLNSVDFKRLLQPVLIRHRRNDTTISLPQRTVHLLPVSFSPAEESLYVKLDQFVQSSYYSVAYVEKGLNRLTLMLLERMVTSSPRALAKSVGGILESPFVPFAHRQTLSILLKEAQVVKDLAKARVVLDLVKSSPDKVIIFTQFRETQEYLSDLLEGAGVTIAKFFGSLSTRQKDDVILKFQDEAQVLISTDSGAEGRNLQFCKTIVNFDFPWNPMKVEQRIGRIHRLGQTRDVDIYNVYYKDSIEEYVVELLTRKIRLFKLVVGELDVILGLTKFRGNLETRIMEAYLSSKSQEERERRASTIAKDFQSAQEEYEKIKAAQDEIF